MNYSLIKYIPLFLIILASCSTGNNSKQAKTFDYEGIVYTEDLQFSSSDSEKYAVNMLIEAKKAEEKRNYALALIYYQNAIKADSSASLLFMAGNAYFELGFLDEAKTMLKLSLQKDKKFKQSLAKLIEIYIVLKDYKKSEILTNEYRNYADNDDDILKAATYYEKFNLDKSIELLEELYRKNEDPKINDRLLSKYYFNNLEDKYYNLLYDNLLNDYDVDIASLKYLALYFIQNKESDKLIKMTEKMGSTFTNADLEYYYEKISYDLSTLEANISADIIEFVLQRIDDLGTNNTGINFNSGVIAYNYGKKKYAESYFKKATESEEYGSYSALQIGMFYYYNNEITKSKSFLLSNEFNYDKFWEDEYFLAQIHLYDFEFDAAISYFKRALEVNSENVLVYSDLGLTYDRIGKLDSAIHYYEIGLKLDSNNIILLNNLAYYLVDMGIRIDEAEIMINKVLAAEPNNPIYLDTYGWLLFRKENYLEAKKYLLKANEDSEKNAEILYHIAMVYYKLGNLEESKKYLGEAKELEPNNKDILELFEEINSP